MITAQALNTSVPALPQTPIAALLVPLHSPVRAMRAYRAWSHIKKLDAHLLADVGMTEAERDAVTYFEVLASV